ncbi:MAG: class I SAM-dependent DNA methyltransferase [Acidimicrobiia bacterium]
MSEWDDLAPWWIDEVTDPAYADDVQPVVDKLLIGVDGPALDLGCGDGRLASSLPEPVIGCDLSMELLKAARGGGVSVVQCHLPDLEWARPDSFGLAVACLVLEHIPDAIGFFESVGRVVRPEGALVLVANHPAFTSGGAGPVIDQSDGEVMWRWGTYLVDSIAAEPAGDGSVVFHHRSLAGLLSQAARSGWVLEEMIEAGASQTSIARVPALQGQEHMPRLVGMRWRQPTK